MRAAQPLALPAFAASVATTQDEVRALEAALLSARTAEERFRGLVEAIDAVPYIADWDVLGTIRYISPQVERMLGHPREAWYTDHDLWERNLHPDDRERVLAESAHTFSAQCDFACEYRILAADGRILWIAERETIVRDEHGQPRYCHGVMFDVTRLKSAEQGLLTAESALREERDLAQQYLDVARTLLLVLDADGSVRLLNQFGHELLGYPAGSLIGCDWFDVAVPAACREVRRTSFLRVMAGLPPDVEGAESELVSATGDVRVMSWRHALLTTPDGVPSGTLSSGEDITERLRAEAEIRRLAFYDPLTGLANRSYFDAELRAAIRTGEPVGLLFVDLDDFKQVNDTHGHAAGDELLRAVAHRLVAGDPGTLVGRHGGDEFLVLLRGLPPHAGAAVRAAAATVAARLAEPYTVAGHDVQMRASVGAAVCPDDARDADDLLRRADVAMYRAKRRTSAPVRGR